MSPHALRAFFIATLTCPLQAGQVEAHVSGELAPGTRSGTIGSALGAPTPIQLTVPSLLGGTAPSLASTLAPTPGLIQPVVALTAVAHPAIIRPPTAKPGAVPVLPVSAMAPVAFQRTVEETFPRHMARSGASGADPGRVMFDQAIARSGEATGPASGGAWSRLKSSLFRADPVKSAAPAGVPRAASGAKDRLLETASLGYFSLGLQLLSGIVFLIAGAHAAYPVLAGALWAFGGAELITHLGYLRSVIVGGWQASHDQKMRHDYATGELRDIRGHKYGEDRYDIKLPGPVSTHERTVIDAAAVLFGLPWVVGGGPIPIGLYLLSASAALYLRRVWRRSRPQPKTATAKDVIFERDR